MTEIALMYLASIAYHCVALICGTALAWMGYRLFAMGIFEKAGDVKANWGDKHILIKSSAPGTFFVLAAALVMGTALTRGVSFERHNGGQTLGDHQEGTGTAADATHAEPPPPPEHHLAEEHVSAVTQAPAAAPIDDRRPDAVEPATAPTAAHLNQPPPPHAPHAAEQLTRTKSADTQGRVRILAVPPAPPPPQPHPIEAAPPVPTQGH